MAHAPDCSAVCVSRVTQSAEPKELAGSLRIDAVAGRTPAITFDDADLTFCLRFCYRDLAEPGNALFSLIGENSWDASLLM